MNEIERRTIKTAPAKLETRADGRKMLTGYAAVFYRSDDPGTQYELWDQVYERIMPTAFNRALSEKQDVVCCFNHDDAMMQGRTSSGTCRLSVDSVGLRYECDLMDVTNPPNIRDMVERGDLTGSSFAFRARSVTWTDEGDSEVRSLVDVDLFDVGPVTNPAYAGTSTGVRSKNQDLVRKEVEEHRNKSKGVEVTLRLLDL